MHTVASTINTIRAEQSRRFYERDDAILMIWLCIVAAEHGFLIGTPGTAKTELVDDTFARILNSRQFATLMTKFKTPESVLGPIDMQVWKTTGDMHRKRSGFIQDAHFIRVDEIGRMNPMLGDELLPLYNERMVFEVNGSRHSYKAPLLSGFAMSNSMLTDNDSDQAAALWDRQTCRVVVEEIKDDKNFVALMKQDLNDFANPTTVEFADLEKIIRDVVPAITIDESAVEALLKLRKALANEQVYPSARRWNQSKKILRANAFLEGRDVVFEEDLSALRFVLWETLPHVEKIERLTASMSNPHAEKVLNLNQQIRDLVEGMATRKEKSTPERSEYAKEVDPKLQLIRDELVKLYGEANGRAIPKFADITRELGEAFFVMYDTMFDLNSSSVARSAADNKMKSLLEAVS